MYSIYIQIRKCTSNIVVHLLTLKNKKGGQPPFWEEQHKQDT